MDLNAFRAEVADGPVGFLERGLGIVHRQRGRESDEAIRMLAHELGHGVVGDPRQLDALGRLREQLDRRRRQRQHLLIAGEHVHDAEADV